MANTKAKPICRYLAYAFAITLLFLMVGWVAGGARPVQNFQFMMDTVVEQKLYGFRAEAGIQAAEALLRSAESKTSLFRTASEVSAINQNAGIAPVAVSAETYALVETALEVSKTTNGAFTITTAPLKELWDITSDTPRIPTQAELDAVLPLVNDQDVLLDDQAQTVFLRRKGQKIDLGGIAKGDAAARCAQLYREKRLRGYVSVGGNVATVGKHVGGKSFKFGIRCPREGNAAYLGSVSLHNTTLATSGDYERYFIRDGVRYHHILNPKTGKPAQSDLISVSVVCEDGALADALSTAMFVAGREKLEEIRAAQGQRCEYIAVDHNKAVYVSAGLRDQFQLNPDAADEYHLAFAAEAKPL